MKVDVRGEERSRLAKSPDAEAFRCEEFVPSVRLRSKVVSRQEKEGSECEEK